MVSASDFKIYKTTSNLGGAITGTEVVNATPNNLFGNIKLSEIPSDRYACVYLKNTHATEDMDNFKWWLSDKSFPHDTELKWGFDVTNTVSGYRWAPYRTFNGSGGGVISVADAPTYDLNNFTVACWFRTTDVNAPPEGEGFMICKGGWLSADPDKQLNYGMWHSDANHLRGGFEETDNTDHIVTTSSILINDGQWHHGCVTYNGANVRLYYDGVEDSHSPHATSATPATSTNPLVIGDNSFSTTHLYYKGNLDEVCIWNRALSGAEVTALFTSNTQPGSGLVYQNHFGTDSGTTTQTIANQFTAPTNITWNSLETEPISPNIGKFTAGETQPIWLWYHVNANAVSRLNDNELFSFSFDIPSGGTGTPGGGTGGEPGSGSGGNPPPTPTNYKIAVVGDEGAENATDDVIALIQGGGYNHLVSVGDHGYGDTSGWKSKFTPLKTPFLMRSAYGNHEYDDGVSTYKSFFADTSTYFTYKFQNIQFFVFDTNINCDPGSAQHTFITNALTASQTDNAVVWRIAVCHHPWFGASSSHSYDDAQQVEAFHQLFINNKVSLVLTGHNHNWQESFQVGYNSGAPKSPNIVDSTPPYTRNAAGLIHIVTGTGGHDSGSGLYSLGSQPSFQRFQNRTHNGIWEIVASNSGNTLTCSFVEIGGDKFSTFVITA